MQIFGSGQVRGHKTYTKLVSSLNFVTQDAEIPYCFNGYTGALVSSSFTVTWAAVTFDDAGGIISENDAYYTLLEFSVKNDVRVVTMDI